MIVKKIENLVTQILTKKLLGKCGFLHKIAEKTNFFKRTKKKNTNLIKTSGEKNTKFIK